MALKYIGPEEENLNESPKEEISFPVPYYTYALIACIIAVSIAELKIGFYESADIAGFLKSAFILNNEVWRIITGGLLHLSPAHILMNSYALYIFGRPMEILSNRANLPIVFLVSIIGGHILSLVFMPYGNSVGASGGITGLIGYLALYGYKRRELLPPGFMKSILINIASVSLFGIILYTFVDNFAHLGGFLSGGLYGFLQIPRNLETDPREASKISRIFSIISLGIIILGSIFSILLILGAIKI